MTEPLCYVCKKSVELDDNGQVRHEGTRWTESRAWAFGPHPVHHWCVLFYLDPFSGVEGTTGTYFFSAPSKMSSKL